MSGSSGTYAPVLPASADGSLALAWVRALRADDQARDLARDLALPAVARRDGIQSGRWRRYVLPDGSLLLVSLGDVFGRRGFRTGIPAGL